MDGFNYSFRRKDLIEALDHIGITIPSDSKLSDEALDRRLRKALDASQAVHSILAQPQVDVLKFSRWPSNQSVFGSIRRINPDEVMKALALRMAGEHPYPLYQNVFRDFRETLATIARNLDNGLCDVLVKDREGETFAICIRVHGVYMPEPDTPLILVSWMAANRSNGIKAAQWALELYRGAPRGKMCVAQVQATDLEARLLVKVLEMNSRHLPADISLPKRPLEQDFKPSFLLPAGPLDDVERGRLNSDFGCVVCGKKSSKRCSQCQSASYCSTECQKADWSKHKRTCRSLKGGTWVTLPFSVQMPGREGRVAIRMSRFDMNPVPVPAGGPNDNAPPPNIHGTNVFLVKIQTGLCKGGSLHIYDRQRSLQVWTIARDHPQVFRRLQEEIEGPRGGYYGMKMYRWAKRTGDLELTVCLDREPQEEIKW